MTLAETILPDLPDSERIRELRFHLRSLQHDVAATIARLETCLPVPALEPAAMWRIREIVEDAAAAIEHDARLHAQRALELVSADPAGADRPSVEIESAVTPPLMVAAVPGADDTRVQLAKELGVALAALARAGTIIVEVAATRGNETASLRPRLTATAETLQSIAWPATLRSLALARALHHAADPAAAAAEARADELATPLNEIALDGARALASCPRCGAPLTSDDRTFDGSYCENCRSRFFERVPGNK